MDFLPLILIIIVVYLFWIRPKIKTNKLKELQNNLLKYGIKGMSYRNFNHKLHSGSFFGYICNEPENSQDKNAIAIYNNNGLHLGYIPAWKTEELKSLLGEQLNISVKILVQFLMTETQKLEWYRICPKWNRYQSTNKIISTIYPKSHLI